jgi:hypothetical protein
LPVFFWMYSPKQEVMIDVFCEKPKKKQNEPNLDHRGREVFFKFDNIYFGTSR